MLATADFYFYQNREAKTNHVCLSIEYINQYGNSMSYVTYGDSYVYILL